jgi:hypothetical protein
LAFLADLSAADAADAAAEAADAAGAAEAAADADAEPFIWWSAAKAERESREASSTTVVLDMTDSFYGEQVLDEPAS